uniref:Uncharacterized protein n=1 Tax=Anguilla anguilla TaxID=7936 RepID=A0A0E9W0W0_ANGAN
MTESAVSSDDPWIKQADGVFGDSSFDQNFLTENAGERDGKL